MHFDSITFSGHAIRRMFDRALNMEDVEYVIRAGEIIKTYEDDTPYPSCLILGYVKEIPIHAVIGINNKERIAIVITAYIPDPAIWQADFRTRRKT